MLREMTSSALAHSFKRFARLAVAGLALAGLAACGGGGSSTTPTPCPQGQVRVDGQCRAEMAEIPIRPALNEYGSVAFAVNPWGAYASRRGTSRTAARNDAVAACESNCSSSSSCGCQEVLWVRNACGSLAKSGDNRRAGAGWDTSDEDAAQKAIAACSAAGGQSCRVATTFEGDSFRFCVQAGSATPSGQASMIPARSAPQQQQLNEYGSFAFSMNPWGAAGSRVTTSQTAARDGAVANCESACSSSSSCGCREVLRFRNACGSLALSTDNSRAAVGWGETESAAGERAIARCHAAGGQGCRVSTTSSGRPNTLCAQVGSATPSGQASSIPPRPASPQQPALPQQQPQILYGGASWGVQGRYWAAAMVTNYSSAAEAEREARMLCESLRTQVPSCTRNTDAFFNACYALSISDCTGICLNPALAGAGGTTRAAAQRAAIDGCESALSSSHPNRGSCRIATLTTGPAVECVGTAQ